MAMLYTPQQLAGGAKYSRGVRVGNWFEDIDYADTKVKDYINKRDRGELASTKDAARSRVLMQQVPHSHSGDGSIKYGFTCILRNSTKGGSDEEVPTNATVTGDHFTEMGFGSGDSLVFGQNPARSGEPAPQAANTVVITKDKEAEQEGKTAGGDTLCYGDLFYICTNPSLRCDPRTKMVRPPLFLTSRKKGLTTGLSGMQGCVYSQSRSRDARWKVEPIDQRRAVVFEGKPVPANEPVLLRHASSNQLLACHADHTDHGDDFALLCNTFKNSTSRKSQDMAIANHFTFVTSSDPSAAVDKREFFKMTPELILEKIRAEINKRGSYAIRGLGRSFRIMDDAGDGMLDREDFKYGLSDYGVHLGDDEFEMVMQIFDGNKDGFVSFDEFLKTLRGPMPEARLKFVRMAHKLLDRTGDGRVDMADMAAIYDTSKHPDVISGKATREQVLKQFMTQWDKGEADGIVSMEEFVDYYQDVSASIDSDDYFELMMRNAWHISGGEGQMENTTCRRVLVIHGDGSQTVEEIKNDLGIGPNDLDKMRERLEQQGVTDIAAIKLTG